MKFVDKMKRLIMAQTYLEDTSLLSTIEQDKVDEVYRTLLDILEDDKRILDAIKNNTIKPAHKDISLKKGIMIDKKGFMKELGLK